MRRQIHIDKLRDSNPKTLEVIVQDALRKPILQLSPQTLTDLVALSEIEQLPKKLQKELSVFAGRVAQEIADLPDGSVMKDFLEGLDELDAQAVPATLREYIAKESTREGRDEQRREQAEGLVEKWSGTEPAAITLSDEAPDIQHAEAANSPESITSGRKSAGKSEGKKKKKPRAATKSNDIDVERTKWISSIVLEKLTGYREKGLAEPVLIAGIRHEAQETYPDLMPYEINKVLRTLAEAGQVRHSAGRWSRVGRFW